MAHNILFLCTGNSARSILAEAICNALAPAGVRAYSAGSQPNGEVNPGAIATLQAHGIDPQTYTSKSWDCFTAEGAPTLTRVITLCDSAANEPCPAFPGEYERDHWGLPDPARGAATFAETYTALNARITILLESLD